jgi:hypothetical protein
MPQATAPNRIRYVLPFSDSQPGHRLGINSFALDTTTVTNNAGGQQGILYSAGRDGMVSAWNLNLQLKKRATQDANGHTSGDIFDDDGQRTTLVASGKSDRAREWDVEGAMVRLSRTTCTDWRFHRQVSERKFRPIHIGLTIFSLPMNQHQVRLSRVNVLFLFSNFLFL